MTELLFKAVTRTTMVTKVELSLADTGLFNRCERVLTGADDVWGMSFTSSSPLKKVLDSLTF